MVCLSKFSIHLFFEYLCWHCKLNLLRFIARIILQCIKDVCSSEAVQKTDFTALAARALLKFSWHFFLVCET